MAVLVFPVSETRVPATALMPADGSSDEAERVGGEGQHGADKRVEVREEQSIKD